MGNRNPQLTDKWIGQRIHQRRKHLKLTQTELAKRIGVTFQQIQKYERGKNRIAVSRLHDIAKAMGTSIGWFIEEDTLPSVFAQYLAHASAKDVAFIEAYFSLSEDVRDAARHLVQVIGKMR